MPTAFAARRPNLTESSSPTKTEEIAAPTGRICSGCYLTEMEWNNTGIFGCSRCYETFAETIAPAILLLHGVQVPDEWARPKPRHTVTIPWPTRRGVRI